MVGQCGTQTHCGIHQKIPMLPTSKQKCGLLPMNTSGENNCIPSAFQPPHIQHCQKQALSKVDQLCEQSQSKRWQFPTKPVLIGSWIFQQLQKSLKTKCKETDEKKKIAVLGWGVAQRQGACPKEALGTTGSSTYHTRINTQKLCTHQAMRWCLGGDLDPSRAEFSMPSETIILP